MHVVFLSDLTRPTADRHQLPVSIPRALSHLVCRSSSYPSPATISRFVFQYACTFKGWPKVNIVFLFRPYAQMHTQYLCFARERTDCWPHQLHVSLPRALVSQLSYMFRSFCMSKRCLSRIYPWASLSNIVSSRDTFKGTCGTSVFARLLLLVSI